MITTDEARDLVSKLRSDYLAAVGAKTDEERFNAMIMFATGGLSGLVDMAGPIVAGAIIGSALKQYAREREEHVAEPEQDTDERMH